MTEEVTTRDRAIRADLSAGRSLGEVARTHSVPPAVVERVAAICGLPQGHAFEGGAHVYAPDVEYKPSTAAADVLEQIGWSIKQRVASRGRCTTRDAALCESIILEDLTLAEAGDRADVTGERMRQILRKHTGLSTRDLAEHRAELREARRLVLGRAEAEGLAAELPAASLTDLAEAANLSVQEVSEVIGDQEALRRRRRNTWSVGQDDAAVLNEMQRVASLPGGSPLTTPFYDQNRLEHTVRAIRIIQRFGTWTEACTRAGVASNVRDRVYERAWSEDQLLEWVTAYVQDVGAVAASYSGADQWLRERKEEGAPSAQTVRNYLGTWVEILETVADRLGA